MEDENSITIALLFLIKINSYNLKHVSHGNKFVTNNFDFLQICYHVKDIISIRYQILFFVTYLNIIRMYKY